MPGRLDGEVVVDARDGQLGEDLLRLGAALPADDEGFVVHGHQLLEDLQVPCRIVGGRQQAAEDAGLVEDQRLAALPVAAQGGEGLAMHRHLLLVRLGGELLHRQQALDQGGGVLEGKGDDGSGWSRSCSVVFFGHR